MSLKKTILLVVSGSIAAYKIPDLCRLLRADHVRVIPVLSRGGSEFVTALTLSAICGEQCFSELFDLTQESQMGHIQLARLPDLILVAPASANLIAKIAHGLCDDLASTLLLASDKPIMIYPAMNPLMWQNSVTQANILLLQQRGIHCMSPDLGDMACGEQGVGRMRSPETIFSDIQAYWQCLVHETENQRVQKKLVGKYAVITVGATQEMIDPVRFISNHSSGRQGFAIAEALRDLGAVVTVIYGKVDVALPIGVKTIYAQTADAMLKAVQIAGEMMTMDLFIACAAVADWKVKNYHSEKIKKQKYAGEILPPQIEFCENPDILAFVANQTPKEKGGRRPKLVVGFAAESENLVEHAKAKIKRKNCDLLLANHVGENSGFGETMNQVYLLKHHLQEGEICIKKWQKMSKSQISKKLCQAMSDFF